MNTTVGRMLFSLTRSPNVGHGVDISTLSPLLGASIFDGGRFGVSGTVAIDSTPDVPVRRRVRLFCRVSGRLVAETWSNNVTGAYAFNHVRIGPWTVIGYDHTGTYNAVVADNVMGVPM